MTDRPDPADALRLLAEDHRALRRLFEQARNPQLDDAALAQIAGDACAAWERHTQIERELFYPRLLNLAPAKQAVREAEAEHELAAELIAKLAAASMADGSFRAQFAVLADYVERHVAEEEKNLFPLASAVDLGDMAARMRVRQGELRQTSASPAPPGQRRTEDGRLDIGTAEDRNPAL